jgi:hypothetical protein
MSSGYFGGTTKVASGGYLYFLRAPFGTAAAKKYCPNALFWFGIVAGAVQAQYWLLRSWQRQGGQLESV